MTLGKGLQSLIPPSSGDNSNSDKLPQDSGLPNSHNQSLTDPQDTTQINTNQPDDAKQPLLAQEFESQNSPLTSPVQDATYPQAPTPSHPQLETAAQNQGEAEQAHQQNQQATLQDPPKTAVSPSQSINNTLQNSNIMPEGPINNAPVETPAQQAETNSDSTPQQYKDPIFNIEVDKISSNPYQPRQIYDANELRELSASIKEYGILQPLVVIRIEQESESGTQTKYQLIAGERRLEASKLAGLERVPAIIKEKPAHEREILEMALIENIQRANLNPLDTARAYAKLQDEFGLSQREISQRLGKSRESVANSVRLLQLPRNAQLALTESKINESQARLLLQAENTTDQNTILAKIMEHGLTVRQTRSLIDQSKFGESTHDLMQATNSLDPQTEFMRKQLEENLGARVSVTKKGPEGKITIKFHSEEELQSIIDKFL